MTEPAGEITEHVIKMSDSPYIWWAKVKRLTLD